MIIDACLVLSLPFPPSVNHYWRWVGRNRVIVSPAGHRYRKAVLDRVFQEKAAGGALNGIRLPLAGRLAGRRGFNPCCIGLGIQTALTYAGVWRDDEVSILVVLDLGIQTALTYAGVWRDDEVSILVVEDAAHASQ